MISFPASARIYVNLFPDIMDAPPQPPRPQPPAAAVPNAMDHLAPLGLMINNIAVRTFLFFRPC